MPPFALPLNVLVAAPRPPTLARTPSRMRVEAVYDALEAQGQSAHAEWLWPPTWDALVERLRQPERQPVAALFLDALFAPAQDGPALYFQTTELASRAVLIAELGALLVEAGVPVLILCATAEQPTAGSGEARRPVGMALSASGVPHSIVMDPGLGPKQTTRVLTNLATELLAGHTVAQAVEDARKMLGGGSDGLALYQAGKDTPLVKTGLQGPGVSKIIHFPAPELAPAWEQLAMEPEAGGLPPEPERGLVGRGREMALLEEALRGSQGNGIVVVSGPEGIGKSTLVAHAARWLVRSGRFAQVVYTDFVGGGYPEVAIHDLGIRLLGHHYDPASSNLLESVEHALGETPTLIVWDHLESILPQGQFAFPPQQSGVAGTQGEGPLGELLELGARFARTGQNRLVVVADRAELPHSAYGSGPQLALSMELLGLEVPEAQHLLAPAEKGPDSEESVWKSAVPEIPTLIRALNGHPLSLAVLAPLLAERSVGNVLDELDRLMPGMGQGEAPARTQTLEVALQPLFLSLPDILRDKMATLGLFVAGMMEPMVTTGTALEADEWARIRQLLARASLLHEEKLPGFGVPLVRFHPALTRHLARRLVTEQRRALAEKYCGSYMGLASWVVQNERRSPESMHALARRELPNFRHAFQLMLEQERLSTANDYIHYLVRFLDLCGYSGERDALWNQMQQLLLSALSSEAPLQRPQVLLLINQGDYLLANGRLADAGPLFQQLCQRMEKENGLAYAGDEARYDQGIAFHRLGRCLHGTGKAEATASALTHARDLLSGMIGGRPLQEELLSVHQDLGEVLLRSMQIEPAAEAFAAALGLATELQDRRALANIEVAQGTIAAAHHDAEGARQALQRALDHWAAVGDKAGMAATWNQLGALDHAQGELTGAEQSYREALKLAREAEHLALQAQVLASLTAALELAERYDEAEAAHMETIGFYQEHNQRPLLARAEAGLADLFLRRGKVQDARIHAEAARALAEDMGPEVRSWEIYTLLQRIAVAEGDGEREAQWRVRAQESYASSPMARQTLQQWKPVIVGLAHACRGEALESSTVELMEKMEQNENLRTLVATLWRILGGERGAELYESLDFVDSLVVRRLLELINAPDLEAAEKDEEKAAEAEEGPLPGLKLPPLLEAVKKAIEGDGQARQMLGQILVVLSAPETPQIWREFAAVLVQILQGNRNAQELSQGLSSHDLANAIGDFIKELGGGSS
jgi:tetratricopeptide (TPR) repeat protein